MSSSLIEQLPALFTASGAGRMALQDLDFQPLVTDGRVGAEIHRLYGTQETGADGPAAAIVRYLPGAEAQAHVHPGYELIFVLDGELETEDGTYGRNSLLVMEPGSVHAPRSPRGFTALVIWERPVLPA
ncbi:ChrR-like protein with cupin domain [Streptomyces sp. Ag109_O5-1]|uniref:cupin domain-containing protein n=1 Tax=Streptomyces sp. Ag109_O5-1 TaxID=1938851 RepID=UPI000F4DB2D8|nr:cupin domain-containing protein [Streptomyces sp. Ag109_O5-1]RPE47148.1 ChrR-like protein with cupin domain [Streptomyces sp. Ag109_O5-1]